MSHRISRRKFVASTAAASAFAFTYVPQRAFGANDRFLMAAVGAGGKGASDIRDQMAAGATFVAFCDVDATRASGIYKDYPDVNVYEDFRVMLEKEPHIDAVTVGTPDHTHAAAALAAMQLGKHVYVQKPLTHSIYEARVLAEAARYYKVHSQMGNQAHAGEPIRRAVELVRAGLVGPVREVHAWTNRPTWPQGAAALAARSTMADQPKPADFNWDLWLGPAADRPYNACYAPFKWRGWWDFGTGALGDMACHIMDMPYWALDLGAPTSVSAETGGANDEAGPEWSTVSYHFAAREKVGGGAVGGAVGPVAAVEQPAVKFVWYDGSKGGRQNAPYELIAQAAAEALASGAAPQPAPAGRQRRQPAALDAPQRWDLLIVGDAGMMLFQRHSLDWIVSPASRAAEFASLPQTIRRDANEDAEWIAACRGGPAPLGNFDYSGPFTEMVLLGTLAQRLGKPLEWDAQTLRVTNAPEADALIRRATRPGWEMPDLSTFKARS